MKLSEIKEIISSKLPEKYQSPDYIKILNNESYDYTSYIQQFVHSI